MNEIYFFFVSVVRIITTAKTLSFAREREETRFTLSIRDRYVFLVFFEPYREFLPSKLMQRTISKTYTL